MSADPVPAVANALVYEKAHSLADFQIKLAAVPVPQPGDDDLLVRVRAISINPVDGKIRSHRDGTAEHPVILGWDAAGEVAAMGAKVRGFKVGDKVYYAGDLTRPGCYAEYHAVDFRIAARMPKTLSFAQAAALPLTSLTAWEGLFEKMRVQDLKNPTVLVWGGAGGVGSIVIQLLKARTKAVVVATASRPESSAWCTKLGADVVIDHKGDVQTQLQAVGISSVDAVFSTTASDISKLTAPKILRPFGQYLLIDDAKGIDTNAFHSKALSIHVELMFTKSRFGYRLTSQGKILALVAKLVDQGKIRSTLTTTLKGLTPESIKTAHTMQESAATIGKTVVELAPAP